MHDQRGEGKQEKENEKQKNRTIGEESEREKEENCIYCSVISVYLGLQRTLFINKKTRPD